MQYRSNEAESSRSSSVQAGSSHITQQLDHLHLESELSNEDRYAIERLTKAINERPTEAGLYQSRGNRYFKTKNYKKAVSDLMKAVQLAPSNEECVNLLRHILVVYVGVDHDDIEEIFSTMSDRELGTLGDEFSDFQLYDEAVRCYTIVLNRKPSVILYRKRGYGYMKQRNFEMAILDFRMVLELSSNPDDEENADTIALRIALSYYPRFIRVLPRETLTILPFTEILKLANGFESRKLNEEALHCYSEALKKNPHSLEGYKQRGKFCLRTGHVSTAINDFLRVANMDPDDEENWMTVGHLLYEFERFDELIKCTKDLKTTADLLELGDIFSSEGKWTEAIRCFCEALEKEPDNPEPYKRRGHLYWIIDVPNMAVLDFLEVAKLEPADEENWNSLSEILIESRRTNELIEYSFQLADTNQLPKIGDRFSDVGKYEEALLCYTKAIERIPEDAKFYVRRAICHFKMQHLDEAVLDSARAMELDSECRDQWDLFSRLLFEQESYEDLIKYALQFTGSEEIIRLCEKFSSLEKFDEALHCYSKALESKPHDPQIYKSRGCFYLKTMDDKDMARADFLTAAELHAQDNPKHLETLHDLLFESGGFEELISCTQRVEDEDELAKLGNKFYDYGKVDEAFRCYSEGLNKYPWRALYHNKVGQYHLQMQNLEQAISYFKRAVKIEPDNRDYRFDLINVLDAAEKYDEDAREAISGCGEVRDLTNEDKAWVNKMNKKVETKRTEKLIKYVRGLVIKDTNREMNALSEQGKNNVESSEAIKKLEINRDRFLIQLKFVHSTYTPEKIFPDLNQTPPDDGQIPDYLTDKIYCYELMEDPVTTPSGITYEKSQIMTHLQYYENDPISRVPLRANQLRPNYALKEAIQYWKKSQHTGSNSETNL